VLHAGILVGVIVDGRPANRPTLPAGEISVYPTFLGWVGWNAVSGPPKKTAKLIREFGRPVLMLVEMPEKAENFRHRKSPSP
jgi:hypothetical protein